ncbi:MAG: 50S ribosomal protein L6 [Bacillota bacterium]
MSRIGVKPITIPQGVSVTLADGEVTVKGPKGTLTRKLHPDMKVNVGEGEVTVERPSDSKTHKSMHGLTRTLIANMVTGVTEGYTKRLEISGMGYRASKNGDRLVLNLGFIRPVEIEPPKDVTIEVPAPTQVTIQGIDKEVVGQIAADIRRLRPPEPYQGTGVKYAGEVIRRKAAKAAK